MAEGLLAVDDLGRGEGVRAPAAAIRYARDGRVVARAPLRRDIYRLDVNPAGHGFIAVSRDAVVHIYDENLHPLLETSLADSPEMHSLRKQMKMKQADLNGMLGPVALTPNNQRYLVTVADEAWCIGLGGEGFWAVKMPLMAGWTKVSDRTGAAGTSKEINAALAALGLSFPVTPKQVKMQYQALAEQYHPDMNPGPDAEERIWALSRAASVLTGWNEAALAKAVGARYRTSPKSWTTDDDKIAYPTYDIPVEDSIYASAVGPNGISYLGTYTGRVVVVDPEGRPLRAYDLGSGFGSSLRRIAETGDFLYLLTDTRLYVLQGEALHAVVDTFEAGSFIVGQTGFGILEPKLFRWFAKDGRLLGSVASKDPIRRVYGSPRGLIVESRTRRAVITGAPGWWDAPAGSNA
jgi:CBS domain-containing protein